jgi:hypothetical protein
LLASARRPVHSSSPMRSTQSSSPSHACHSSFGRQTVFAPASDERSDEPSTGTLSECGSRAGGGARRRRVDGMLREVCGGDWLARCTEGASGGDPLRLGGYVCEESIDRRRTLVCPCASMSRLAEVAMGPPTAPLSPLSPSSIESIEERKSGSWSAGSGGRVIPAEPPALTIESMSQNWTTFMNIGKRPIVLLVGTVLSKRCETPSPERKKIGWGGETRTRRLEQYRWSLTNLVTRRQYPTIYSRKRGGEQRGASWR